MLGNRSNSARSSAQALAAKTVADGNGKNAQERRHFDKDFATVEQVRVAVLEIRVSENTVQEEQYRGGKDKIVQAPPQRTANTGAEQGREEHEQQEIERYGTGEVKFWLKRRLDGQEDVEQAKVRLIEKEEDGRMGQRKCDGHIGSPLVEREKIHASMGPALQRAVAHRHEHAEP
jgi:hypothetical protein